MEEPDNKYLLIKYDPFIEVEKHDLKAYKEQFFEHYKDDIDLKISGLQIIVKDDEIAREHIFNQMRMKFQLKQNLDQEEKKMRDFHTFKKFFKPTNIEKNTERHRDIFQIFMKNRSNIEIQVRLRQGYLEVSQDKPVPPLGNAILIQRVVIDTKNSEIRKQGTSKMAAMNAIKEIKFDVAKAEHDRKIYELKIKQNQLKNKEIQMLRVTKEMHAVLTKKDTRLNEQELKNLSEQIEKIKATTEKRVANLKKKEEFINKEIKQIIDENNQLRVQGSNLNSKVKQIEQIEEFKHKNKKQAQGTETGDNESFKKFRQIAFNRKLFDLAKRQTEEIELLREELNKLKASTFANFSNVK